MGRRLLLAETIGCLLQPLSDTILFFLAQILLHSFEQVVYLIKSEGLSTRLGFVPQLSLSDTVQKE